MARHCQASHGYQAIRGWPRPSADGLGPRLAPNSTVPRIPTALGRARRSLAVRFSQLASGHAMIAPFLEEKFKWVSSSQCWWCGSGRQSREHLFKECRA